MPHIDEWIRKIWGIYTMEYYSVTRKSKTIIIFRKMEGTDLMILRKISQGKKVKCHMSLYMQNLGLK
jgi:hypothetical protein